MYPYGINTHRLLVRGVRVLGGEKKIYITTEAFRINTLIVMPVVALPIIFMLLIIILVKPVKNNKKVKKYLLNLKNKINKYEGVGDNDKKI